MQQRFLAFKDKAVRTIMKRPVINTSLGIAALILTAGAILIFTVPGVRSAGERLMGQQDNKITREIAQEVRAFYVDNVALSDDVAFVLMDGPYAPPFATNWEFESLTAKTVALGTVQFNNRRLPAEIAEVTVTYVNRIEGTHGTECFLIYQADATQWAA